MRSRVARFAVVALFGFAVPITLGVFAVGSAAQTPSSGNGAKRFDDLRELNNKLGRAIAQGQHRGSHIRNFARERRMLQDLEVTKLRAVDQFPPVFGLAYGRTFVQLSCVDEQIAVDRILLDELQGGYLTGGGSPFRSGHGVTYANTRFQLALMQAKKCKDRLELELSSGSAVPRGVSDDLRELNNKLDRAIAQGQYRGSHIRNFARERRMLQDLEVTKLRAVDQFPEILDPPYIDTFRQLSCVDEQIAVDRILLDELQGGYLTGGGSPFRSGHGVTYANTRFQLALMQAKKCKDTLEIELMHSFDLKPSEQGEVGVNQTTPSGTDTQDPNKLNAPKPLEHAYARDGFVGRHEHDYVATGLNGGNPDSWPPGRNALFFDVFDLFGSPSGAQKAELASEQNLKSTGFSPVSDSSLGPGEAVFQKQSVGSPLLSTIIYVQRGTFILKVAGSCRGCHAGSIESSLKQVAQTQLNRAVINGFPGPRAPNGSGGSTGCSGDANLTVTLSGNAAPSGTNFDFSSAIPTSCNIGIRNNGSGTAASNWSSDVHDASNSSTIYFCHDGPPGTPPGESPCPGTQQPSNFAGGSLYQDVFKASDGTWHISMQVLTRQSYNVSVRVHYSWTPCTSSC